MKLHQFWKRLLVVSTWVTALVGVTWLVGAATTNAEVEVDREATRREMRDLYANIKVLLPLSFDEEGFRNPEERESIRKALSQIAERANHLSRHIGNEDPRIEYLAGALSREARETLRRFEENRMEGAEFFARRFTDFCLMCHSRLPSAADSPLSRDFLSDEQLSKLPLARQAELQVATRRFDDALASYEVVIGSPRVRPAELFEPLTQYLAVAVRVKGDLSRPLPALKKLLTRPDLWASLRSDVERWVETLERYAAQPPGEPSLESARALLDEARDFIRFPSDRQALVNYLLASSQLHRFIDARSGEATRDLAEAYYLSGLIERRIHINQRIYLESDFYLETAIRMDPNGPMAKLAYGLLEEETELGWTGSSGSHMPQDVRRNLDELRALVYPE